MGCIFLAGFSLYSFIASSTEKEKSEVYKEVEKIEDSTKDSAIKEETEESSSIEETHPELEHELSEEQKRAIQLEEQMSHTDIYNPMTNERLDRGISTEILGNIVSPEIGLDIEFWQGVGYKTGAEWSQDPESDDQRMLKATGTKKDQVLGVDNVVFAGHSAYSQGDEGKNMYFGPLLKSKDNTLIENPNPDDLMLQKGDSIFIYQKSDNKTYEFIVSNIFVDSDEENKFPLLVNAQGDIKNRPQLTLYVCSNRAGDARLVVQAEFIEKK
ncbi:MAG: sortase [Candidatus Nanogingivalis sp.]